MDRRLLEYYTPCSAGNPAGRFHAVIDLETHLKMGWEKLTQICPTLPQGWFELVALAMTDRIELMREHWLLKMAPSPKVQEAFTQFFRSLDYVGVFLTQRTYDDPFEVELVYQVSGQGRFFRGRPGATLETITTLQKEFVEYILPVEYTSFLQVHDGFANGMDVGMFGSRDMALACIDFQDVLAKAHGEESYVAVPLKSLIPFYQSSERVYFECFWDAWHPHRRPEGVPHVESPHTMGVLSVTENRVETMASTSFLDWLILYLKKVD